MRTEQLAVLLERWLATQPDWGDAGILMGKALLEEKGIGGRLVYSILKRERPMTSYDFTERILIAAGLDVYLHDGSLTVLPCARVRGSWVPTEDLSCPDGWRRCPGLLCEGTPRSPEHWGADDPWKVDRRKVKFCLRCQEERARQLRERMLARKEHARRQQERRWIEIEPLLPAVDELDNRLGAMRACEEIGVTYRSFYLWRTRQRRFIRRQLAISLLHAYRNVLIAGPSPA